jgi:hypothetical protein
MYNFAYTVEGKLEIKQMFFIYRFVTFCDLEQVIIG